MDIWCVDSGLHHALLAKHVPDYIVGDCDSVAPDTLQKAIANGAKLNRYSPHKSASDLELTLHALIEADYTEVTLVAVSGGRTDHTLFNWLLMLQRNWPFRLRLLDASVTAHLVHAENNYIERLPEHTTLSLVSSEEVLGVTTTGLVYPLTDATLKAGHTLGLSNQVAAEEDSDLTQVEVAVGSGRLLVCVVHELD